MAPYGRLLNDDEQDQGGRGSSGFLGPRTEQFALGSLYYLIKYGFEVYGDRRLTEDRKEHGRKVVDLLQNMEFPNLDGDPLIDDIIIKCWHNRYATIKELATCTETLLPGSSNWRDTEAEKITTPGWRTVICRGIGQHDSAENISPKQRFCQNLDRRGLLHMLSLGEPEQLGFSIEWYRYSTN